MASKRIKVGMGEGVVVGAPSVISAEGLGSCVALTLYYSKRRMGGMAHIMLPNSDWVKIPCTPYQCADRALTTLLKELQSIGANIQDIVAKMVGGAQMFPFYNGGSSGIGEQNIMSIKYLLRKEQIPLVGSDVGGTHGRSLEFQLDSGRLIVMAIGREDREI